IFNKYGETNKVTVDHCLITKQWIRGPLCSDCVEFDVRNNVQMDWVLWSMRAEGAKSLGNFMGNLYIASKDLTGNAKDKTLYTATHAQAYFKDNQFRNCAGDNKATLDKPVPAPPIVPAYTTDLTALEKSLLSDTSGAGCMPRDKIDKAYIAHK